MESVFVVVLNWNGWRDTIECLESLLAMEYPSYRIVVVDNASTDDSWDRITAWGSGAPDRLIVPYDRAAAEAGGAADAERCMRDAPPGSGFVLIQSGENLGFAGGSNVGVRYALLAGAEHVWLLNNDTVVEPDALSALVTALDAHPELQVVTPQIRFFHDRSLVWNCGGFLTWYGTHRYLHGEARSVDVPPSGVERITFVTGCAPLLRSTLLRDVGLLTTRFFFGTEDIEFSQRLKKAGKPVACVYDSVIYHKVGSSLKREDRKSTPGVIYHYYLGIFINMRDQFPRPAWLLWRMLYLLYILPMARYRYRIAPRDLLALGRRLLRDSSRMDVVDRATFENAVRGDFRVDRSSLSGKESSSP